MTKAAKDKEMPEIDFDRCKVIQRGPVKDRKLGLAALRGSQALTQTQLAVKAGLSQGEVSRAESRVDCLVSTLKRYAQALDGATGWAVAVDPRVPTLQAPARRLRQR